MAASKNSFFKGFLSGLAAGLLLALGVAIWVGKSNPFLESPAPADKPADQQASVKEAPNYDFHKTLPGEQQGSETPAAPATIPAESYYLQTGAFLNLADAEEMKAKLALVGFEATIEQVEDKDGVRLHKVRIGPFDETDELNQARTRLTENNIDTLLIKVPPANSNKETP